MPQAQVFNIKGDRVGEMGLPEPVFGVEPNRGAVRAAVLAHEAKLRAGTASAKTRAEVRGGGRKPWRQKGLGRARHGSIRSPIWKGGGVTFGPKPRDYGWSLPKKVKRLALVSALSAKADSGNVMVIDDFSMESPKTKEIFGILKGLGVEKSVLVVTGEREPNLVLSCRNIPGVKVVTAEKLGTYDAMAKRHLLMTKDAVSKLEEVLS